MIVVQRLEELGFAGGRPLVLAIGNFDGLHRGHQAIMARIRERAQALGGLAAAMTFDPHPRRVLDPENAPRQLMTRAQKLARFGELGLDATVVVAFDRALASMPAEEFAREILCRRAHVSEIHVGEDFRFGRGRAGDLALLQHVGTACRFTAHGVAAVLHDGERISTSRVKSELEEGHVREAALLLGRPFSLMGTIVHGEGRGGNVLVPTANLAPENEFVPARGVYITRSLRADGSRVDGLTNVGIRPTFGDLRLNVETFLPGFEGNLYGERLELQFLERLREERKFDSPADLMAQIRRDLEAFEGWRRADR